MDLNSLHIVKLFFYILVIASMLGLGVAFLFTPKKDITVPPDQKQAIDALNFQSYLKANYSFAADADVDGLSDAKEVILGSDPLRNDTDGDGYIDGQEMISGYDPIVPGKARLSERNDQSLTVQYINWLGENDVNLNAQKIRSFLQEKRLLAFSLPPVLEYDIHFTNNDPEKIGAYLTLLDGLALPEEGSPYLAFAGNLVKNTGFTTLANITKTLDSQRAQIENAAVPPVVTELHRIYAGVWKELGTIFNDLTRAQQDPVLIFLDQQKGEWLVEQVQKAQELRAHIITQLKLAPFEDNASHDTSQNP